MLKLGKYRQPPAPGSQASSRGEAKDTALLSSRDGYILELTVWPKMSQASCGVWRDAELGQESQASSCLRKGTPLCVLTPEQPDGWG